MNSPHGNGRRLLGMEPHNWGECVGALLLAIMIAGLTSLLHTMHFEPLTNLIVWEEQAYRDLYDPPPRYDPPHEPVRVVFLDIDQAAVENWAPTEFTPSCGGPTNLVQPPQKDNLVSGTPRGLLASLTKGLRIAAAAVIYLDYDLSYKTDEDELLKAELACHGKEAAKVLLPRIFASGRTPPCLDYAPSDDQAAPVIHTQFDMAGDSGSVGFVHPLISARDHGLIDSVCMGYPVSKSVRTPPWLPAAMSQAIVLAGQRLNPTQAAVTPLGLRPIRWWVDRTTVRLPRDKNAGPLSYFHVDASLLLDKGSLHTELLEDGLLRNAIVVVGSTHDTTGEVYQTPIGEMPGALVHANIAIDLQAQSSKEPDGRVWSLLDGIIRFNAEVGIFALFIVVTTYLRKHWFRYGRGHSKLANLIKDLGGLVIEMVVMTLLAIILFLITVVFKWLSQFAFDWDFSIANAMLGILVAFIVQAMTVTSAAFNEMARQVLSAVEPTKVPGGEASERTAADRELVRQ